MADHVIILGTRGSVPACGAAYAVYGGSTSCYLVSLGGEIVVLDGGTGLMHLPTEATCLPRLPLVLTHAHMDHLLGLPLCPYLARPDACLVIYAATRGGLDAEAQVHALMAPPLWPVGMRSLPARVEYHDLPETFGIGGITVRTMEGVHPGGVSLLRLEGNGKSVVLLSDCTLTEALYPRAAAFAADCDLLLCDGQYSDEEWPRRRSFGHSTWTRAAELGRDCGARRTRIIHHDPRRTDEQLFAAAAALRETHPFCDFAREGEEVSL